MIKFSQMLAEGRDAPLYRTDRIDYVVEAIRANVLQPHTVQFIGHKPLHGISASRNLQYAEYWGAVEDEARSTDRCVIQLDQTALARENRIEPYNWFSDQGRTRPKGHLKVQHHHGNEQEEFIIGPIKNFNKKVLKIFVYSSEGEDRMRSVENGILKDDTRIIRRGS